MQKLEAKTFQVKAFPHCPRGKSILFVQANKYSEVILFAFSGKLISLSEQQLVDCDHTDGGCNGGDMGTALTWLARNGGSIAEADYRYVSGKS